MKKLLTGILTAALCLSMAVPAFATEINQDSDPKEGKTEVTFNVDPAYTVTIPGTVELEKVDDAGTVTYEKDLTVSAAAGARLLEGQTIQVTLASDFELDTSADANYKLPYTVKVGASEDAIKSGDVVATFGTSTTEQTSVLHFAAEDPAYAGDYSDTVTFTISTSAGISIGFDTSWESVVVGW